MFLKISYLGKKIWLWFDSELMIWPVVVLPFVVFLLTNSIPLHIIIWVNVRQAYTFNSIGCWYAYVICGGGCQGERFGEMCRIPQSRANDDTSACTLNDLLPTVYAQYMAAEQ